MSPFRKFVQKLFRQPVGKWADKYSSRPDKERVHEALTSLLNDITENRGKKGEVINFDAANDHFIIFSDQHKGRKNGADDFAIAENNYLAALDYYYQQGFLFINLGDCEELWENTLSDVKKHNTASFEKERLFLVKSRFIKIFGNHDLYWGNAPLAKFELEKIYGEKTSVCEGAVLQTSFEGQTLQIFLTHGHQGDTLSDGNWFSKWFVSNVWAPLQSYLGLNPNTPAYDDSLKTVHNRLMYEWSAGKKNAILITGHTHQPVFESLTRLERLYHQLWMARQISDAKNIERLETEIKLKKIAEIVLPDFSNYKPSYFNTGCCCFSDGDITGIEIGAGMIRLVKWENTGDLPTRVLLEEVALKKFIDIK